MADPATPIDDVVLNKAASIERAVLRAREEFAGQPARLRDDQTRQDAIILNLMRAAEVSDFATSRSTTIRGCRWTSSRRSSATTSMTSWRSRAWR